MDSLLAKANVGAGTDQLAGVQTPDGFAGAVALVDDAGALVNDANPLAVGVQGSVAVTADALPLPTGAATQATLAELNGKAATAAVDMPVQDTPSLPVRQSPQKYTDISFSQVGSGLLSSELTLIRTGAGMTVSQSAGNLVIASGTTANSETVIRSVASFNGAFTLREVTTLSQRILNNNFFIEMVDVLGDNLAYTIINATTVDVTRTAHGFTAANVGQRIDLVALSSVGVPMEGVIASIPDANTIRFTVAGWPASGSGTLSLTGWNKVELLYTAISGTVVSFNTRRRGWQNTATTPTVASSATGHMLHVNSDSGVVSLGHKVLTAGTPITNVSAWEQNIPLPEETLFIQLRARNGTTAPASTTTWTVGMVRVEDYVPAQVNITGVRQQSLANALQVAVVNALTIGGTVATSLASTTVTPAVPATPYILNSLASTNEALIVTGTSGLQSFYATNTGAGAAYVKLYNKATAPVSTDIPAMLLVVPAAVSGVPGVCVLPNGFSGQRFALGLGIRVTGGAADNDTTAVAAGQVKVMLSRTV